MRRALALAWAAAAFAAYLALYLLPKLTLVLRGGGA